MKQEPDVEMGLTLRHAEMNTIIFSDLDGSLLNHHDYDYREAEAYLKYLEKNGVRVIFVTSKTRSEVVEIRERLNNFHPFVVENGGAVFIPTEYSLPFKESLGVRDHYFVKPLSNERAQWLNLLQKAKERFPRSFSGFSEYNAEEISKLTGLSIENARKAANREFGEPINWVGSSEDLAAFKIYMTERGANVVVGGRFIHVGGSATKGGAISWLIKQFATLGDVQSIAVGDSENDASMLNVADHAVVIKNPSGKQVNVIPRPGKKIIHSTQEAPVGWVEGVSLLLEKLEGCDV